MNVLQKTKLLPLLLVLLLLAGCAQSAGQSPSAPTQATEQSLPPETEPVQVKEDLELVKDGLSEFRIVYGAGASEEIMDAARQIQQEIQRLTGAELPLVEDMGYSPKAETWEILVGATDRDEDDRSYAELTSIADYLVCVQGRKLTVAANLTESLTQAVMALEDALSEATDGGNIRIPADFRLSGGVEGDVAANVPAFGGGTLLAACDGGDGTSLLIYQADREDCDAYIEKLTSVGYTFHARNEIDDNRYYTLLGSGTTVTVMDNPGLGTVRIAVDPTETAPATEAESFTPVVTPSVTMLGLEGYNTSGTPNQNGLSLLYQLSDGSFIVVDGGHNVSLAARQLYSKMMELAPDPANVTIAAWIITHSHNDHAGAFLRFTQSYAPVVKLEKLIVNFPNDQQYAAAETGTTYKTGVMEHSTYYPNVEVIKAHPGQVFYIRDAEIQVLYTLDLYEQAALTDFNDSSVVCTVSLGGQKLMQTGDCGVLTSGILTRIYDEALKCDILQVSHHGYQGGTEELYREVDPSYVLWPSGSKTYEDYKGAANNVWLLNESNMLKLWVARDDIYTLILPIGSET